MPTLPTLPFEPTLARAMLYCIFLKKDHEIFASAPLLLVFMKQEEQEAIIVKAKQRDEIRYIYCRSNLQTVHHKVALTRDHHVRETADVYDLPARLISLLNSKLTHGG
jgi:hypothetical protein